MSSLPGIGDAWTYLTGSDLLPEHKVMYDVVVPPDAKEYDQLIVQLPSGQRVKVQLPAGAVPGMRIRVAVPTLELVSDDNIESILLNSSFIQLMRLRQVNRKYYTLVNSILKKPDLLKKSLMKMSDNELINLLLGKNESAKNKLKRNECERERTRVGLVISEILKQRNVWHNYLFRLADTYHIDDPQGRSILGQADSWYRRSLRNIP